MPSEGLRGEVEVPGDKSMSHRALILGALAAGETRISGLLEGADVLNTASAIRAFGAEVERLAAGEWRVRGCQWRSPSAPVECGNSGTGARLLIGAAAGFPIEATFVGDRSLSGRPMERVLAPLREMGASTDGARLPVTIRGGHLAGIRFTNTNASAQVKSAILLAGLQARGQVEVIEPWPSRNHTENMLRAFGCEVETEGPSIRLGHRRDLTGTRVEVRAIPLRQPSRSSRLWSFRRPRSSCGR
jgi:3-phosphoshikimate 1-carboxyvinyltransferase